MTAHLGCYFNGYLKAHRLALHTCKAAEGASGSPILQIRRGRPVVVGIHVVTVNRDKQQHGGAVLTDVFAQTLSGLIGENTGHLPPAPQRARAEKEMKGLLKRLGADKAPVLTEAGSR
jgi:hypothetical protein